MCFDFTYGFNPLFIRGIHQRIAARDSTLHSIHYVSIPYSSGKFINWQVKTSKINLYQ